jgi:riboflavin biosynthesis pyrimidine reductase
MERRAPRPGGSRRGHVADAFGAGLWWDHRVQQIYPGPAQLDDDALIEAYAYPDGGGRPYVRANMVTSLDGAAQGPDGRSGTLSSPADKRVFAMLRGLADVILVGAGTARVEKYGPAEAQQAHAARRAGLGQRPAPPIAVVSRRLDLDPDGPLFEPVGERTIVLTSATAPADRREALAEKADVVVAGEGSVDVRLALDALAGRGLRRVLCEGGPRLLGEIVVDGLLDDLCLTFSPLLRGGDAPRALNSPPTFPRRMRLAHVLEEDGTLLTRWLREDAAVPPSSADEED